MMESTKSERQSPNSKTQKLQGDFETDSSFQVDSGIGDSIKDSIPSDRSCTDSYYDESRDQECSASMELVLETAKLAINSDEKCVSVDQGYTSISQENELDAQPSVIPRKPKIVTSPYASAWSYECMRLFSQTEDVRFLLAPCWQMLLHQNEDGDTSLHLGIINCKEQAVLQIIDVLPTTPQCFDIYNDLTQTPLHLAAITSQHRIVEKLIDHGASVDLVDRNGQTCVHLACQRGDLKTLKAIFKRRPGQSELQKTLQDVLEKKNFDGLTPLCVAVKANHIEIVKKLILTHHVDVEAIDNKSGNTALHLAVEQNNLPMVSCLLFKGDANPNAMSYSSNTPLHIAAGLGLETIIATLIAMGASGSIENMEGDTAFRIESESSEEGMEI